MSVAFSTESAPPAPSQAADPKPPLLELRGLTVGYRKPIVTDLNLKLGRGLFVSILGANGAGKSTLLRTISRRLKPLAGEIFLAGQSLPSLKAPDLARIMSVALTDRAQVPMLRALEFVALGRHPHSDFLGRLAPRDLLMVEKALTAVQAGQLAERFVDELSDGERQKVVLARALAQEPKLLLLDEPTAHLDLRHRLEILAILRQLCQSQGLTVLAAVHDVEVAAKVSDLVVTLKDGRLVDLGRPEEVLVSATVQSLYDCPTANFNLALGGLELIPDGQAGRAFVWAGQDTGALPLRVLAKKGYALATGLFPDSDLDAHVARALGAKVFSYPSQKPPTPEELERLGELALGELATCDLLALGRPLAAEPMGELRQKLLRLAQRLEIPVLELGPTGELGPFIQALDRLKTLSTSAAA
ncbi:MAG: ABC transporter ATP-binding protein [Deltaproteobacteria bacterium]|nr:ABC transporter ATP-binding protein [Deltaproteobacteria bacterium]